MTTTEADGLLGKPDWAGARSAWESWWRGDAPALHITAPRETPLWEVEHNAAEPPDLATMWLDPRYRVRQQERRMAGTFYGGVAFPMFDPQIGPGSLGLFLGCGGRLAETTVWYEPSIPDPTSAPPIEFTAEGYWWDRHTDLIEAAASSSGGRYVVGMPDLIENLDTLAQLRDPEAVLLDIGERPEWVRRSIDEINVAYMECFDLLRERIRDPWGGNSFSAFQIWGVGRTAKIQCDICCAISARAFREIVQPAMQRQCDWLDHSLFHLDGTQALHQLDNLLDLDALQAIEWTPQHPLPGGGSPDWYDLYRRILSAGKSVQAIGVAPSVVEPLLDATGGDGMLAMVSAQSEAEARALLARLGWDQA